MKGLFRSIVKHIKDSHIIQDSSVLLVANWSSTALSIVTSIVLTHMLGADGYGLMILTIVIVNTIVQFLDIRTGDGLVRFVGNALARDEKQEAFTYLVVGLTLDGLLMAATLAVVLLLGPVVIRLYPTQDTLRPLIQIYALSIPFSTLQGTFMAVVVVHKRFRLNAIGRLLGGFANMAALLALAPFGLQAVIWGQVISAAVQFLTWFLMGGWLLVKNIGLMQPTGLRVAFREFIPFAFHTSITASVKAISANMDSLLLGALLPVSAVAYFRVASSAASLIATPTSPVSTVLYPEMNEAWAVDNIKRVRSLIYKFVLLSLATAGAIWAVYLLAADWLVMLLYPPDFSPAGDLIRILGFEVVILSTLRWIRPVSMTVNKPQLVTTYSIIQIILRLVMLSIFTYYWGLYGAAWSHVVVIGLMTFFYLLHTIPRLNIWDSFEQVSDSI